MSPRDHSVTTRTPAEQVWGCPGCDFRARTAHRWPPACHNHPFDLMVIVKEEGPQQ